MKSLNRILTNADREFYKPVIDGMFKVCPEMMARKIGAANVQQAFALDYILKLLKNSNATLCCAGSFEDTVTEYLKRIGNSVVDIDPAVNMDLHKFRTATERKFDIVFSVSVLEHVINDEEFIDDMCFLLNPGGTGVVTCDFNNSYTKGMPLPATDVRFFTRHDLEERLVKVLQRNACALVEEPDYTAEPDFIYQGHLYSFATFVFKKV